MKQLAESGALNAYVSLASAIVAETPPQTVVGADGADAQIAAGLAVYRNNVRSAYLQVLRDAFPVVERLVGEEFFRYLAHEYFYSHPPSRPLVREYGREMPSFIELFKPAANLPYLADVARIEIAWLDSYHAPDESPMPLPELYDALNSSAEDATLKLHPSLRLLSSSFPAYSIWRHNHERKDDPLELSSEGENIITLRAHESVEAFAASDQTYRIFRALADGVAFGEAIASSISGDTERDLISIIRTIAESKAVIAVGKPH